MARIEILKGDITKVEVDAIVNAANNQLKLGSGVAGAIRVNGGPTIQEECDRVGAIKVGDAAITGAGNLPARYVIHAASMNRGGLTTEPNLRGSVKKSLRLADEHDCKSIAFPAIGAGVAGFPLDRCAKVMKEEIGLHLAAGSKLDTICLVLFGDTAFQAFKSVIED